MRIVPEALRGLVDEGMLLTFLVFGTLPFWVREVGL